MADWYVSSAAYASVPTFAISTAYTVGQFVKPITPALKAQWVMRCTTAGTSAATEPTWPLINNSTVTSGTAVFTNVTGQSAYGWSAAAGDLPTMFVGGALRFTSGERIFISSDHSETQTTSTTYGATGGGTTNTISPILSVNRAGSVPPVAADLLPGATCTISGGSSVPTLETVFPIYYYGITFINTGGAVSGVIFATNTRMNYFDTCQFYLNNTSAAQRLQSGTMANTVFYNTTVRFGHIAQFFASTNIHEITWLNTPAALAGAIFPTTLFGIPSPQNVTTIIARGVDLSAVTGTLVANSNIASVKALFDSCRIAPGVTRYSGATALNTRDEVELFSCYDGTNIINERYQPAGAVTTDFVVTLSSGGATDNVGVFSHRMVSSTFIDKYCNMLTGFCMDMNYTTVGSSQTATVEIISSASLNNDDISLELEYPGTSGSSLASFVDNLPATVLTAASALPTSTATWNGMLAWNPVDLLAITLSGGNLIATSTGAGSVRGLSALTTGKYYWECTVNTWSQASTSVGVASPTAVLSNFVTTGFQSAMAYLSGALSVNSVTQSGSLGARSSGDIIGIAVDGTAHLIWFRVAPSGNWNGSGTANPATGVGGFNIAGLGSTVFPAFGQATSGQSATANFGATAFTGTVPSGFSAPPSGGVSQKLQVTFTPQTAGRLRGRVRLGKPSTTVYYDPQMTIT